MTAHDVRPKFADQRQELAQVLGPDAADEMQGGFDLERHADAGKARATAEVLIGP